MQYGTMSGLLAHSPKNNVVAFVGDSITAMTTKDNNGQFIRNSNQGYSFWLPTLTRQRVITSQALNFGVPGDTAADVLARMQPILSCGAGIFVGEIGRNDIGDGTVITDAATLKAQIASIWSQLLATGATVIWYTIWPAHLPAGSQSQRQLWDVNTWMKKQMQVFKGLYVIDSAYAYGDPTSATSSPRAGYSPTGDGTHPTALGAFVMGRLLAPTVELLYPDPGHILDGVSDSYDTNYNPRGNLVANGFLTGSGGSAWSGHTGGQVPDNWQLFAVGATLGNLWVEGSQATMADGRSCFQLQITRSSEVDVDADSNISLGYTFQSFDTLALGDRLIARCEFEVTAGTSNIAAIRLNLSGQAGSNFSHCDGYATSDQSLTAEAFGGVLMTPEFTLTAIPSAMYLSVQATLTKEVSSQALILKIAQIDIRKQ